MSKRGLFGGIAAGLVAGVAAAKVAIRRAAAPRRKVDAGRVARWFTPLPSDRTGSVVVDGDLELYYEQIGPSDAPLTVVFAHGISNNRDAFRFQRAALRERFGTDVRAVFYDHRSHGRSDRGLAEHATIDQLGGDLFAVLETLVPTGPVVLVGHSLGGMTIMALAAAHPELFAPGSRVVGVALVATSSGKLTDVTFGLPAPVARAWWRIAPLTMRKAAGDPRPLSGTKKVSDLEWLMSRRTSFGGPVDPALVEYITRVVAATPVEVNANYYAALVGHDKLAALVALSSIPVLVICGEGDVLTPPAHSQAIAAALPHAELLMVPDTGHMVMMERPDIVNDALEKLVSGALSAVGS